MTIRTLIPTTRLRLPKNIHSVLYISVSSQLTKCDERRREIESRVKYFSANLFRYSCNNCDNYVLNIFMVSFKKNPINMWQKTLHTKILMNNNWSLIVVARSLTCKQAVREKEPPTEGKLVTICAAQHRFSLNRVLRMKLSR